MAVEPSLVLLYPVSQSIFPRDRLGGPDPVLDYSFGIRGNLLVLEGGRLSPLATVQFLRTR